MILTNCAACAAPLAHNAPRCEAAGLVVLAARFALLTSTHDPGPVFRRHTRYCDATCQHDHWRRGHKQVCKEIHRGGNAEQYHADKKYKEAVAVAVEACAEDTKGQTCYICTQALHWKTKEGLVRGCACRGTAGFAHVSCLAEQAKILVAEAEENNLDLKVLGERFQRWYKCSLCEQDYHGVVCCALGWACWKTYVDQPARDLQAMAELANGLSSADHDEDALSVYEAELSMRRRRGSSEHNILIAKSNLANIYRSLGRHDEALSIWRDNYVIRLKLAGEEHEETMREALCYALALNSSSRFEDAKALMRRTLPVARRVLGDTHDHTFRMRACYASALYSETDPTLSDLHMAANMMENTERTARRVLGGAHPTVVMIEKRLREARAALRARETHTSGDA